MANPTTCYLYVYALRNHLRFSQLFFIDFFKFHVGWNYKFCGRVKFYSIKFLYGMDMTCQVTLNSIVEDRCTF